MKKPLGLGEPHGKALGALSGCVEPSSPISLGLCEREINSCDPVPPGFRSDREDVR